MALARQRLKTLARGEGALKGREWNAGDGLMRGTGKDLLKTYVFLSLFLRIRTNVSARIPLPTRFFLASLGRATFSPGEG